MNKYTQEHYDKVNRNVWLKIIIFVLSILLFLSWMVMAIEETPLCPGCASSEYREAQFSHANHRQYPKRRKHEGLDWSQRNKDKKYKDKHV